MAVFDGLIAYWSLKSNGSGGVSLQDDTGNGYTLLNNGGVGFDGSDPLGNGGNFATSFLQQNSVPSGDSWSFQAWVQSDFSGDPHAIQFLNPNGDNPYGPTAVTFGNGAVYTFFAGNDSSYWNSTNYTGPATGYNHIVATCDNTTGRLAFYVNGNIVGSSQNTSYIGKFGNFTGFLIGGKSDQAFIGQIGDVGLWNRGLSAEEVSSLYNNGSGYRYTSELYYNNSSYDEDWGNLSNWWQDSIFTISATSLPDINTNVNIYGNVSINRQGSDQCFCGSGTFWSYNFAAGLTLQASGVVNFQGTSILGGNTTDGVSMHDSSQIAITSTVYGDATLRDSSRNHGHIVGNANVYYDGGNGQLPIGGTVDGYVDYLEWGYIPPSPSGGGGTGTISRLLKLPWFINI